MASIFAFVRYLRLKFLVSLFRLANKLLSTPAKANPDSVVSITSRDKYYTIKAHLYKPSADGAGAGSKAPHPVLLNFYGSGFAIPLHGADDGFCRLVALAAGYAVLDVEYRLGPEYPFPAAINDVQDAVRYVLDRPKEYNSSQVSVSGFSSGGTLALIAPTLFPRGLFQSVIAFYPATNLAVDPSLRKAPAPDAKPRSTFSTKIFRESYIGAMDPRDPRISPAYADTSNYPANMLVITGELDTSALEAEELAAKAQSEGLASGRNVVSRRMKRCGHSFDKRNKDKVLVQARDEAYGFAVDMLKKVASESG
jgi:acetyl esterase/lipase